MNNRWDSREGLSAYYRRDAELTLKIYKLQRDYQRAEFHRRITFSALLVAIFCLFAAITWAGLR
jgi:hypothetical protein